MYSAKYQFVQHDPDTPRFISCFVTLKKSLENQVKTKPSDGKIKLRSTLTETGH